MHAKRNWGANWLLILSAGLAASACKMRTDGALVKDSLTDAEAGLVGKVPTKRLEIDGVFVCPREGKVRAALFDADSTLRVAKSGAVTATYADDVYTLPFAETKIAELNQNGYLVAIVSNQGGATTPERLVQAEQALVFAAQQLARLGGVVDYIDFAEANDNFRKPAIGMALRLDQAITAKCGQGLDWTQFLMFGDSAYLKAKPANAKTGAAAVPAEPRPDGRPAENFSNADRLLAVNMALHYFNGEASRLGWNRPEQLLTKAADLDAVKAEVLAKAQNPDVSPALRSLIDFETQQSRFGDGQFQEPNDAYVWGPYGVTYIEDVVALKAFVELIDQKTPGRLSRYHEVNGPVVLPAH